MQFQLNGKAIVYKGDPKRSLLKFLREDVGITTPKDGCSGQGYCGACTVQLDDKAVLSCTMPMKNLEGKSVTTTDGLSPKLQETFAKAFTHKGGIQCGFCVPGIVMGSKVLLEKNPNPSLAEIKKTLNRHVCRCTGYKKVIESIQYTGAILRGEEQLPNNDHFDGKVGSRLPKYDTEKTVLGMRPYVCDYKAEGMQYGVLKFSDHPRAKVLKIHLEEAAKAEGVTRIFTAKDIPGIRIVGLISQDWPVMIAEGEVTNYVGDVLACVVAKDEESARKAISLIKIDYDVLEPLIDMELAINSPIKLQPQGNILSDTTIIRGDAEEVIKNSKYVAEGTFYSQRIEHAFIEPECAFALPWEKDGKPGIQLYSQGQGAYEDRKQISKILNLPLDQVNVIQVQNGGGFGGKEDLTVQGHAALCSFILGLPVQVKLSREESLTMHPKRHPMRLTYKLACDEKGILTAMTADILGDSGAYASVGAKVLERAAGHSAGAYNMPVCHVKAVAVYTNNIPSGAMRGFGVNQTAFAIETLIDELCEKGGFDRWQFRYNNALREGSVLATGQILDKDAGLLPTLIAMKDVFQKAKYAGIACGIKNTGVGNGMADTSQCMIEVTKNTEGKPHIVLHHGWTEMGQGVHTMAIHTFCEETGISPAIVDVKVDTKFETVCGMTTSSRGTSLVGNAMIDACKKFNQDLEKHNHNLDELIGLEYRGEWICDWTTKPGKEKPGQKAITHYSYAYGTQVVILDEQTGEVKEVHVSQDCGKIMNEMLFEGQVEGAIHMGLGYALTEDFPMKDGRPEFVKFAKCGILKATETPEMFVQGVEVTDKYGPYGAKGVGEIGLVPVAAAAANALYQFDKVRRYSLPLRRKK